MMRFDPLLRMVNYGRIPIRVVTVIAAVIIIFVIGVSGLFSLNPLAPLYAGLAVFAVFAFLFWLIKPVWGFYTAIFLVFLPLGLIPTGLQSTLNRAATLGALIVWGADVALHRRRLVISYAAVFMAVFLIWGLATLGWTVDFSASLEILQTYSMRFLLFLLLAANLVNSRSSMEGLMKVLALNGWILMAAFVVTLFVSGYSPGSRIKILSMNENEAASFGLLAIPGVFWGAVRSESHWTSLKTWIPFLYLGLAACLVAMSGSRGAAISLALDLAIMLFFRKTRRYSLAALGMAGVGFLIAPGIFTTLVNRFGVEAGDTLLGGREAIWQAAWMLILNHFWTGVGIGAAPIAIVAIIRQYTSAYGYATASIHNPVLTVWAETGIIGLVLYLGVAASAVLAFLKNMLMTLKNSPDWVQTYFALIGPVSVGSFASWIKGGGAEYEFAFFFTLALLAFSSSLPSILSASQKVPPV